MTKVWHFKEQEIVMDISCGYENENDKIVMTRLLILFTVYKQYMLLLRIILHCKSSNFILKVYIIYRQASVR